MPRTSQDEADPLDRIQAAFFKNLHAALKDAPNARSISWEDVDDSLLTAAIASATEAGASLLFGKTSDGGALTLIIYGGKKPVKYYPVTVEGANELLDAISSTDITSKAGTR